MKRPFKIALSMPAATVLFASMTFAQAPSSSAPQPAAPPAQVSPQPQPIPAPPQAAPEQKPGVFESFGRWFDQSAINMRKSFDDAWKGMGGVGNSAGDAAKGTADAASAVTKGTADAAAAVTKGAFDAAKGTADAFGKLGSSRFVNGRERCAIAPNGAPDCKTAAVSLCKANGYADGNSVDYVTAENCPTAAYLNGRKPVSGECPIEHTVTRALCQ